MNEVSKGPGAVALGWWKAQIAARENTGARALAARLRRAAPFSVLCEPAVIQLGQSLKLTANQAERLVQIATLLAELRENVSDPLAKCLGDDTPALSQLRFQRLMRAEGDELTNLLRRAIIMADRKCNVAALAADLLHWEAARPRWCFQYFGADAPAKDQEEHV